MLGLAMAGGSETNSKLEFPNVQNSTVFVEYDFLCFGHLSLRDSVIVSNFDIRISYFPACPG
jgi:hypothetical protein